MACQLLDLPSSTGGSVLSVVEGLVRTHPDSVRVPDAKGNIPLHYAIAPSNYTDKNTVDNDDDDDEPLLPASEWKVRSAVVSLLLMADMEISKAYLSRNDIRFQGVAYSPLYRAIQALPDDFDSQGPTVEFLSILREASSELVGVGNASDGDKPLALLYRRFTRQFDLAEKFFAGDNSRPEVVQHRQRYKTAAGNTWRIIELLLRPDDPKEKWRIVHRAVQVETPPDLLRYIVETNAEDLTVADDAGNLPLHYAASSRPPAKDTKTHFPAFYTKYVVDELLYKFPEAAKIPNAEGKFPLTLAANAGKQWIGGGIKSLYDAHPEALKQINLKEHMSLQRALSIEEDNDAGSPGSKEEKKADSGAVVIRDEHHDAIMLVQQPNVDVSEVVTSMWAHEEDAGVQMLGCVAISKMVARAGGNKDEILRIALCGVAGVVNAMKAHPNEVIVQEKACHALRGMAMTDGLREVSFVASGAVAAIVGAMQAHVSDPGVQEEACGAVAKIISYGGSDRATIVASVSGLTAIINAIAAHPDVEGVQREGCGALKELTEFPSANLPELPRSQTEPLLQAAKEKFPDQCGSAVEALLARLT